MYTCQIQKSVQEMKHLQNILEVRYDTLFELEDHVKGADQQLQRWAQTCTSITAVVDQVKKAPHPLVFSQGIKIEMISFSYDMVHEFIYKKEIEMWQRESNFLQRFYSKSLTTHTVFSGLCILPKKINFEKLLLSCCNK